MNAIKKITGIHDMKGVLSTLWIYLAVNYIYCDHLGLMEPDMFKGLATGYIGSTQINQGFLLAAAVLMQIPFLMIVLSRVLKYGANRWTNIIAAALMIAIQVGSMGMGTGPSLVYLFYSTIEITCNFVIIGMAWMWRDPESRPISQSAQTSQIWRNS
jgi:hypothetical protein